MFRRKPKEVEDLIISTTTLHKLVKEWDNQKALSYYILFQALEFTYESGKKEIMPHYDKDCSQSYRSWYDVAKGDQAWANRTAKHYRIEIEDAD